MRSMLHLETSGLGGRCTRCSFRLRLPETCWHHLGCERRRVGSGDHAALTPPIIQPCDLDATLHNWVYLWAGDAPDQQGLWERLCSGGDVARALRLDPLVSALGIYTSAGPYRDTAALDLTAFCTSLGTASRATWQGKECRSGWVRVRDGCESGRVSRIAPCHPFLCARRRARHALQCGPHTLQGSCHVATPPAALQPRLRGLGAAVGPRRGSRQRSRGSRAPAWPPHSSRGAGAGGARRERRGTCGALRICEPGCGS